MVIAIRKMKERTKNEKKETRTDRWRAREIQGKYDVVKHAERLVKMLSYKEERGGLKITEMQQKHSIIRYLMSNFE